MGGIKKLIIMDVSGTSETVTMCGFKVEFNLFYVIISFKQEEFATSVAGV